MSKLFAYYNENDRFAASWLRELMKRGLIADGEVDERSIVDVDPADVRPFRRVHWFETVPLLVEGFPNRVGLLRGLGNAIVPQVAAEFIKAFMSTGPP